jgi:hypothetical protein
MTVQWMQRLAAGLLAATVLLPWHARADFLITMRQDPAPPSDATTGEWTYAYRTPGDGTPTTTVAKIIHDAILDYQGNSVTWSDLPVSRFRPDAPTAGKDALMLTPASPSGVGMLTPLSSPYRADGELGRNRALDAFLSLPTPPWSAELHLPQHYPEAPAGPGR